MKTYIVLLRGINVSGKNKIPMANLRDMLNDLKFQNIQTYIQSGNIILTSQENKESICKKIKDGILTKFGYSVPVIALTVSKLKKVIEGYPFSIENKKIVAFVFLDKATKEIEIDVKNKKEDVYKIEKDIVYLYCLSGFGKTKLTNTIFESKLQRIATTRNYNTVCKLLELATT